VGRIFSRLTVLGRVLVLATVVVAVALAFTRAVPVLIAAAVICALWIWVYQATDPGMRGGRGDDPARDVEAPWRVD